MAKAAKKTLIKAPASPGFVPQDRDQVIQAIAIIGARQRDRTRIEAEMNDELAAIKERYEREAEPHNSKIQELRTGVQIWCEANRDSLTKNGKMKTATFASGEVRWRTTPASVKIRNGKAVLIALVKAKLSQFIRTKVEVNKEAILADREAVKNIAGITIEQREEFVIVPIETALEEVL